MNTGNNGRGAKKQNLLLSEETKTVLTQKQWSLRDAEDHTGVSSGTILNMKRGRNVKVPNILQFARAIAPKGLEATVEQRWNDIATKGDTDLPAVDYANGVLLGPLPDSIEYPEGGRPGDIIRDPKPVFVEGGTLVEFVRASKPPRTVQANDALIEVWLAVADLQQPRE